MRLSNHRFVKVIPGGVYYFSVIFFLLIIFLNYQLGQQLFPSGKYFYPALTGVGLWLIYIYFAGKYVEYNSEGSLISFLNRGAILSEFIDYRAKIYEIKKDKIKSYWITNSIINRRLHIVNSIKDIHNTISLLSPRKTRYLKLSLDKIIAKNQTNL